MVVNKLALQSQNIFLLSQLSKRHAAVSWIRQQHVLPYLQDINYQPRVDEEWVNAKDFNTLPGPSRLGLLRDFLPGGHLHKANIVQLSESLRERYGDIFLLKGMMGKADAVFTYNPVDYEIVYRNEGNWPIRIGLESFAYYRKVKRPDIYQGIGGLASEQGKAWSDIRNKVNPLLMKVQNVRPSVPEIDSIAKDLLCKLEDLRNPSTGLLRTNFHEQIKMWALESSAYIALNTRLGLLWGNEIDSRGLQLAENMSIFFALSYEYDVKPSFWKYIETPGFKRLMRCYDEITEITMSYIESAMQRIEQENKTEAKSILEKLCRIDKKVALVMAIDILMAGIDTTASTFVNTLYQIAKNPEKQAVLRNELLTVMPTPDAPLNQENTKNMPYLRACLKESLRIVPITPGNFRNTTKDLVLSGYRVPRGTGVRMDIMMLSNEDKYFPRSAEFLPERWLKSSAAAACPAARKTNPFVYLPFGFGARTCIGKRIAEMELETLLARLIRNYKVSWQSTEPLKYTSGIILIPHGEMPFKFEKITS